jgi:hypothetical protein
MGKPMIRLSVGALIAVLGPATAFAEQYQVHAANITTNHNGETLYHALVLDNVTPKVVFCTSYLKGGKITKTICVSKTRVMDFVIPPSADLIAQSIGLRQTLPPDINLGVWYLNQKNGDVQFCYNGVNPGNPGCVKIDWKSAPESP